MELMVLNTEFETVGIIDTFMSCIWTDRYNESGDFEICLPMNISLLDVLKEDYYLITEESEHVMIIEDLDVTTDVEEGKRLIVTGRSLEQILDRRIVLNKTSFVAEYDADNNEILPNLQNGIKTILNENIISPAIAARRISNFIFEESTDEKITSLTFEAQYWGDNVYDVIYSLCLENEIGFKITLNDSNQFVFKLYAGVDRSYNQFENPYIVFSQDNDNLLNTSYYRSRSSFKNVAVVLGEEIKDSVVDPDGDKERKSVTVGNELGLARREIFEDANDITSKIDEKTTLTDEQYRALLKRRGIDALIENLEVEAFEGEVEATLMYKYGEDFFIGDIVQIIDEYGHEGQAYISELIISQDTDSIAMYPTFMTIQKGVYDA